MIVHGPKTNQMIMTLISRKSEIGYAELIIITGRGRNG